MYEIKYEENCEIVKVSDECNHVSVKKNREGFRSNIKSIIRSKLQLSDLQFVIYKLHNNDHFLYCLAWIVIDDDSRINFSLFSATYK